MGGRVGGEYRAYEKYEGTDVVFCVPSAKDGIIITEIASKAFLSCKNIQKLELPDTVTTIGDWAFAHMKNLEELIVPFEELNCGKKLFLDCSRLKRIVVRGATTKDEGMPYFLASAVTVMEQPGLWCPQRAGDEKLYEQWLGEYDRALADYLDSPDEEGFEPVFIGWFHVEDMDEQIPRHLEKRRREKIKLILQRLRYPEYLSEHLLRKLQEYLAVHMPDGSASKEHTLVTEVICDREEEYRNQVCYLKILRKSGCLNRANTQILLERMQDAAPESVAYLIGILQEENKGEEFFTALEL